MNISDTLWQQLLNIKKQCDTLCLAPTIAGISKDKLHFLEHENAITNDLFTVIISQHPLDLSEYTETCVLSDTLYLYFSNDLPQHLADIYRLYLPLATTSFHSKGRPFVITHMAQSLDGKVCTNGGESKWIGDDENLIHAHRIRALVDGVMVGAGTARSESPSLNVRHVKGENPARILMCSNNEDLKSFSIVKGSRTIILSSKDRAEALDADLLLNNEFELVRYPHLSGHENVASIINSLNTKGIHSILLEGGPKTISHFFVAKQINWVQLHIAPLIFGSGESFVSLPEITEVSQAHSLKNVFFTQQTDSVMVTGEP